MATPPAAAALCGRRPAGRVVTAKARRRRRRWLWAGLALLLFTAAAVGRHGAKTIFVTILAATTRGARPAPASSSCGRTLRLAEELAGCGRSPAPRPVSDFAVGEVVDGWVAGKFTGTGVLVNIGAKTDALLLAPYKEAMKLEPKKELKGLRVEGVDLEKGRVSVSIPLDDLKEHIKDRCRPVSNFSVGDVVEGVVRRKAKGLVFVDIGAETHALLLAPYSKARRLEAKQALEGLRVENVDAQKGELAVSIDNLDAYLKDRGTGKPRAPAYNFSVGDVVDGRVARKATGTGVFIDVGAKIKALLLAPYKEAMRLEPRKELKGLRVEEVEKGRLSVSMSIYALRKHIKDRNRPVSHFSVGDVVDGFVSRKAKNVGVFVDIGAETNALLLAPYAKAVRLEAKKKLKGLRVESVDLEKGQLAVSLDNLDAHLKDRPVSDFSVGDIVDGRVARKARDVGVFVDIGAEKQALLFAPYSFAMKLEPKEELKGLRVHRVDLEKIELAVVYPGLEDHIRERNRPISDFLVGDVVDGHVVNKRHGVGVLVDIGAEANALLIAPYTRAKKLRPNTELKGLRVHVVNRETGQLGVTCENLEDYIKRRR